MIKIELDWSAISAIGTCLGALATFCACFIALWQTKITYKKKLKIHFNEIVYFSNPIIPEKESCFIGVTIINEGNREVNIREWAIELNENKKTVLILNYNKPYLTKLPVQIKPECKEELYYEWEFFKKNIKKLIQDKLLKENKKIKFSITDMTNKKYYFYSKSVAKKYII